jgi:hypothetical protein
LRIFRRHVKGNPTPGEFLQAANGSEEVALKWISLRLLQFIVEYELPDSISNLTLVLSFYLTFVSLLLLARGIFLNSSLLKIISDLL